MLGQGTYHEAASIKVRPPQAPMDLLARPRLTSAILRVRQEITFTDGSVGLGPGCSSIPRGTHGA
jgi:hypothetical protein